MFKKKWFEYFWIAAIILVITCIAFRPVIFNHQIPFSANLLPSFYEPWMSYPRPEYPHGPANKPMGFDAARIFYPLRNLSTSLLKMHELPLWNPYNFAGNTLLATYQSAIFHPMTPLFLFLSQINAWTMIVMLTPLLTFIGMYGFLRKIALTKNASFFGAITFAFSGFMIVWWEESFMASYTALMLPYILWSIESFRTKPRPLSFISIIVAFTLSITAGWFQLTLYAWILVGIWILTKLRETNIKTLLYIFSTPIIALFVSGIHLIPGLEALMHSPRSSTSAKYLFDLYLLPLSNIVKFIAPDFFGNPGTYNYFGKGFYYERVLYFGIAPLLLALYQLVNWNKHTKVERFFSLAFIITLSLGFSLPTSWFLLYTLKLPLISVIIPSRIFYLSTFAGSVLAAFTIERFFVGFKNKKILAASATMIGGLAIAFGFVFYARYMASQSTIREIIEYFNRFATISLRNLLIPTGFILTTLITVWMGTIFKKIRLHAYIALVLLTIVGSLFFAQKYLYFSDPKLLYPATPIMTKLQEVSSWDRFWTPEHGYIQSNFSTQFRLMSPEGYDSFFIRRYGEFITAAKHKGQYLKEIPRADATIASTDTFSDILADPYRKTLLQLLGVKYIARKNIGERHGPIDVNADPKLKLVWSDTAYQLFSYADALPRAFLASGYKVETDAQKILDTIFDPKTNLGKTIILEEQPSDLPVQDAIMQQVGTATISAYTPNEVTIQTTSTTSALLFLSDTMYPGWVARVDGKLTKVYRADYTFRAVVAPAGTHTVVFSFEPQSVKLGAILSLIGIGVGIILALHLKRTSTR